MMSRGLRWIGFAAVLLSAASLLRAEEPKSQDKKSPPSSEKKSEPKAKAAPKEKLKPLQILPYVRIGKLDNAPKLGIIVKERYLNGNKIAQRDKEIEIEAVEAVIVRTNLLPGPGFDDKGRPKPPRRYTKQEKDEMRGPDKSLPGYTSDMESVKSGQVVNIWLGKKKNAGRTDPPVIILIHILAEPAN
jgi:hypothetical protein